MKTNFLKVLSLVATVGMGFLTIVGGIAEYKTDKIKESEEKQNDRSDNDSNEEESE